MTKKKAWAALVQECKSVQSEWFESQIIQKKVLWQENRNIRELYDRPATEMYAQNFKKGSEFEKAKSRQIEIQKMLWSSNVPNVIMAEITKLESRDKLTKNHPSDPGWAEKFMATCKKTPIPHR